MMLKWTLAMGAAAAGLGLVAAHRAPAQAGGLHIAVSYPAAMGQGPLNGRLLFIVAPPPAPAGATPAGRGGRGRGGGEPRNQVGEDQLDTAQIFGINVENWKPGETAVFDDSIFGYPKASLRDLAPGDYNVQALLNVYTTYHRSDGHTVELPADEGEGQQWSRKPGNLYSPPQVVRLDPAGTGRLDLSLSEKIPAVTPPADTDNVKHIKIESRLLTQFWGTPTFLEATVVLPEGWAAHPAAHYPVMVQQNHFSANIRRIPQAWTDGQLPKFLWVDINHANPYYDDSYAVNSANLGPYGDAITQELIPAVEKQFRGIGQGWARVTYGCSTGGWEAAAQQILYPDFYNGSWPSSPDPLDFHKFQIVNIYQDKNAFWLQGPFGDVPRPNSRRPDGTVLQTMDRALHRELVLGTRARSGGQWAIWQAVFGPVAADGYPADLWDPMSGEIHPEVAAYWRDHLDLTAYLNSHWTTLAPKLDGKLHFAVGEMDSYYLNDAVYLMQNMIESHSEPKITADFDYGPRQPHCYDGTQLLNPRPSEEELYMPRMADRIIKTAPPGADMSWRYDH